jgi:hypothetical protein
MLAHYRENCIMQRKVYQWVEMFQSGRTSIVEDCSGHPVTSQVVDKVEQVNTLAAICSKHRGVLTNRVVLHHDNA